MAGVIRSGRIAAARTRSVAAKAKAARPVRAARPAAAGRRTKSASSARTSIVAAFTVTLVTPDGESTVECDADTYILDAAEVRFLCF